MVICGVRILESGPRIPTKPLRVLRHRNNEICFLGTSATAASCLGAQNAARIVSDSFRKITLVPLKCQILLPHSYILNSLNVASFQLSQLREERSWISFLLRGRVIYVYYIKVSGMPSGNKLITKGLLEPAHSCDGICMIFFAS